jgi:hypothetical protein
MRVTSVRRACTHSVACDALLRDTTDILVRRDNTLIAASLLRFQIGGKQRFVDYL